MSELTKHTLPLYGVGMVFSVSAHLFFLTFLDYVVVLRPLEAEHIPQPPTLSFHGVRQDVVVSPVQPPPSLPARLPASEAMTRSFEKLGMDGVQSSLSAVTFHVPHEDELSEQVRTQLLPDYLKQMRAKIANHWIKKLSAERAQSGWATLRYRIDPNGSIWDVKTLQFEGGRGFDRVCIASVLAASPLDPLPFRIPRSSSDPYVTVTLTFHLRGHEKTGSDPFGLKRGQTPFG